MKTFKVVNNETGETKNYTFKSDALKQFEKLDDMGIQATFYTMEGEEILEEENNIVEDDSE